MPPSVTIDGALRHISQSGLDKVAKLRLERYLAGKSGLKRAEHVSSLLQSSADGSEKALSELLEVAYIKSRPPAARMPRWLSRFSAIPGGSLVKRSKQKVFDQYSPMITVSHVIDRFKSSKPALVAEYYRQLEQQVKEEQERTLNLPKVAPLSDDCKLLVKLRHEFKKKYPTKLSLPSPELQMMPTRFGTPLPPSRRFNAVVKRILEFRGYYRRYSPVSEADLHHLNDTIPYIESHPEIRSGYRLFLKGCFAVTPEAGLVLSGLMENVRPAPDALCRYYDDCI